MHESHTSQTWKNPENWLLSLLGIFALLFFLQTWTYPATAALFPRMVSAIVSALSFYLLVGNLRAALAGRLDMRQKDDETGAGRGLPWTHTLISIIAYFIITILLGFTWGTLIFLLGLPVWMGYRRWVIVAITAVILTIAIVYSFGTFLHIPLPEGAFFKLLQ